MDCVDSAMLSVPPVGEAAVQQPLSAAYSPSESDQAQFEADKRAVYKYEMLKLSNMHIPLVIFLMSNLFF